MVRQQKGAGPNIWTLAGAGDVKSIEQLLLSHADNDEDSSSLRPDPDAQNKLGETAAHIAARQGHAPVLQLLRSHGAQFSVTDNKGWTAAHHAASNGQVDCLRTLSSPAIALRLDLKDKEGKTPLDVAKGDNTRKFLMAWMADAKANSGRQEGGRGRGGGGGGGRGRGQGGGAKGRGTIDYHSNLDLVKQLKSQNQEGGDGRGRGGGGEEEEGRKKAVPSPLPLSYQPLVELDPVDPQSPFSCPKMPRCTFEETGFTPYGLNLGWPKRPKWRGVVKSADELHRLEERSFAEWQAQLGKGRETMDPPPPPISFYEPRLEFWRQLWRVVEFSDIVIMIVDARNPLLHFSHALVRHVIDERGSVPLLVLNKSDLIPAQAAEEWKCFFESRYPGIRVVSGSTRSVDGSGGRTGAGGTVERGTASAIMEAVLSTTLTRGGVKFRVSDLIGMQDPDNVLEIARERATMTKRRPVQDPAISSNQGQAAPVADVKQLSIAEASSADEGEEGEEDEDEEEWDVKGTKMKKKLAKKKKRSGPPRGQGQGKGQGGQAKAGPIAAGGRSKDPKSLQLRGEEEDVDDEKRDKDEDEDEDEDDEEGSGEEGEDEGEDAFEDYEEEEMSEDPSHSAADDARPTHPLPAAGSKPRAAVAVCMVGEPNVGKSSTLNALLGVHRVAVSSHPGRTKHYQTIWMTDQLMLCDCPGLVFPRAGVSLPMQILFGSFPIARCRDPYSVIEYLAVRIWPRLHLSLGLKKVRGERNDCQASLASSDGQEEEEWSVQDLLDAVAEKRG